jgi:hypothetical protein
VSGNWPYVERLFSDKAFVVAKEESVGKEMFGAK